MALTLNSTLATAQDNTSRHPLCEIISAPAKADIPFAGSNLSATSASEVQPFTLALSNKSVVCVYASGTQSSGTIQYIYTNADGTEFTPVSISIGQTVLGLTACELSNGNVGLIYYIDTASTYYLKYRIVTPAGAAVSSGDIASWSNSIFTSHMWVLTRGTNDYILVYSKASGSNYYIYQRTSSNFTTWSSESTLDIGGLTATNKIDSPSLLIEQTSSELWVFFDYVESINATGSELRNIYYAKYGDYTGGGGEGDSYTKLQLHMNGTNGSTIFTDSSTSNKTVTANGNAQISTAESKFGGASGLFDGDGDYLTLAESTDWNVSNVNFTIDFWVKTTSSTPYATLFKRPDTNAPGSGSFSIVFNTGSANGLIQVWANDYNTSSPLLSETSVSIRDGAWHHVALVRNGNDWNLYIDGTSYASATWSGTIATPSGSLGIYVGHDYNFSNRDFGGNIDEFRFSNGIARWTGNFTPPIAEYT